MMKYTTEEILGVGILRVTIESHMREIGENVTNSLQFLHLLPFNHISFLYTLNLLSHVVFSVIHLLLFNIHHSPRVRIVGFPSSSSALGGINIT